MGKDDYKAIFAKNLRYFMALNNKTQNDIVKDLGVNKSAISTWCNGTRFPRMDKIDELAYYFNITRSMLIEEFLKNPAVFESSLDPDEKILLNNYKKLNTVGKNKALDYISDLTENEKYTKNENDNHADDLRQT